MASRNNYLSALRQLSLIAPGGHMAARTAVEMVANGLGVDAANLFWLDKHSKPIDDTSCTPTPESVILDYLENFFPRPDLEMASGMTIVQAQASVAKVWTSATCHKAVYRHSEFYSRIGKPLGYGMAALIPLRHADGKPLACLNLGRRLDASDFSAKETGDLAQIHDWLEHLLRRESALDVTAPLVDDGLSGTLIVDRKGKILWHSASALALLYQAVNSPYTVSSLRRSVHGDAAHLLRLITRPVNAALHGLPALPPSLKLDNRWGRFLLRAYVMNTPENGTPMQISLHIERHVPLTLRLFRTRRYLEFSPREREVTLLILAGRSYTEIARQLGVKPTTALSFTQQIYRKLGISKQSELLPKLLSEIAANGQ